MRSSTLLGITAAVLSLGAFTGAAQAREYPWCARYDAWAYNCGFSTYQQCAATVSGAGGICEQNPRAGFAAEPPHRVIKRKHRRR